MVALVTEALRTDLPPMPARIAHLPVHRGYPVPWFVAWLDDDGKPVARGKGTPDFRVLAPGAAQLAHRFGICWVCGGTLGAWKAFVLGPMCAVNRTSAEPPSHVECAEWSAAACPFLTRPHMVRREGGMPEDAVEPAGVMLRRNPGVALIWVTKRYRLRRVPDGILFDIGKPERVAWYAEGRAATRGEIERSIETGLPALQELAEAQSPSAVRALNRQLDEARRLLPA